MIKKLLKTVCEELQEMEVDYVIVGGSALVERDKPIGTSDVDFAIAPEDFDEITEKLKENPRFQRTEKMDPMISVEFQVNGAWRTVEFLNPKYFSGEKTPEEFIDYLKNYRSRKTSKGYVVDPEIVWYMRLVISDWEIYIQKILRDVRAGMDPTLLDKVLEVAEALGEKEKLEPRVKKTKEEIGHLF